VGTRLLVPDGRLQHCGVVICADGYPRHVYAGFPGDHAVALRSGHAGIVTGACVLVRADAFTELGGFDQGYRNGYEDVDLCLRAQRAGHEIHYCHDAALTHLVSATREHRRAEFVRSEQRFLDRWGALLPTDFPRYLADGLLRVDYAAAYPLRLSVAPELALLAQDGDPGDDLRTALHERRRENVRLRLQTLPPGPGSGRQADAG
jgi:GT2 family glycosyltransferase